jgi:hypothetical protein
MFEGHGYFLLLSRKSFWTNSASYDYKNKFANTGAQLVPTGMPTDYWKTCMFVEMNVDVNPNAADLYLWGGTHHQCKYVISKFNFPRTIELCNLFESRTVW